MQYMEFACRENKNGKANGNGLTPFLTLKAGANRVRFVGRVVEFLKEPFKPGEKPLRRFLAHVFHDGRLHLLDMAPTIYDALALFADGDGQRISGPNAPEFIIGRQGEMLNSRYSVMSGEPAPLPPELDIERLDAELWKTAERLEKKAAKSSGAELAEARAL